jgi:hypothetical protein
VKGYSERIRKEVIRMETKTDYDLAMRYRDLLISILAKVELPDFQYLWIKSEILKIDSGAE